MERYQFSILNTPFESEFGVFDVWCCYGPYDRLPSHSLSLPLPLPLPIHECALSLRNIKCGCRSSCSLDHDVPSKFRVTIFQWTCIRLYALWHNMPCSPRLLMCSHVVHFGCGYGFGGRPVNDDIPRCVPKIPLNWVEGTCGGSVYTFGQITCAVASWSYTITRPLDVFMFITFIYSWPILHG